MKRKKNTSPKGLVEKIKKDIQKAVVERKEEKAGQLRYLYSLIQKEEALKGTLSEEEVQRILRKEKKQKQEALSIFKKAQREDLAEKEKEELMLLEKYLPAEVDEEEIKKKIKEIVKKTEPLEFGRVMGQVMAGLKGRADGQKVAQLVKEELQKPSQA